MVKAVIGDETQLNLAENRLCHSGLTSQVGLVIGKLSSPLDRGFIYDLVPTPSNDAGEPASSLIDTFKDDKKKSSSKSKSQTPDSSTLTIDQDWVSEHARQVSRMLPGGMKVIGIYVWVSDATFKNSTITLCQTVKGVAEAAPISETDWDERLLIHICFSPRRWTCRNCMLSSNITSSSIRPCDFKMGRVLSSLQTFRCTYNFELSIPLSNENVSKGSTLGAILRHGILVHAKELRNAKALINGSLVAREEQCVTEGSHDIELLLPFMKNTTSEACSQKNIFGVLLFSGSVCSLAYSNSKEPVSQALADIKDDIIRSLHSRLDIICDEADEDRGSTDDGGEEARLKTTSAKPVSQLVLPLLRKTTNLAFPRRVYIPWLAGTYICDYLLPAETIEVIKDHCVELMSIEASIDSSMILEPEVEAPSLTARSFWDVVVPGRCKASTSTEKDREIDPTAVSGSKRPLLNSTILAAVFVLILSILVGFVLVKQS